MSEEKHTEIIQHLTQLSERQFTLFKSINKIENHLDRINSKVQNHDKDIVVIETYGAIGLIALPIIINLIMRII